MDHKGLIGLEVTDLEDDRLVEGAEKRMSVDIQDPKWWKGRGL